MNKKLKEYVLRADFDNNKIEIEKKLEEKGAEIAEFHSKNKEFIDESYKKLDGIGREGIKKGEDMMDELKHMIFDFKFSFGKEFRNLITKQANL